MAEFAQLFNPPDADILGVRWHTAQDEVPREMLLRALEIEFINRTNEVGVDVNRCILHPHTANLLQFVAGLGPRKAFYMIKVNEFIRYLGPPSVEGQVGMRIDPEYALPFIILIICS